MSFAEFARALDLALADKDLQKAPLDYVVQHGKIEGRYVVEAGVYSGRTITSIANAWKECNKIYGFDSFEGLPERWRGGFEKGAFDIQKKLPAVPSNVHLVAGWFDASMPKFVKEELEPNKGAIGLLHVDCDIYSSTACVFDVLAPFLIDGSVIVFDEIINYHECEKHEVLAFYEYLQKHKDVGVEAIGMRGSPYEYRVNGKEEASIQAAAFRLHTRDLSACFWPIQPDSKCEELVTSASDTKYVPVEGLDLAYDRIVGQVRANNDAHIQVTDVDGGVVEFMIGVHQNTKGMLRDTMQVSFSSATAILNVGAGAVTSFEIERVDDVWTLAIDKEIRLQGCIGRSEWKSVAVHTGWGSSGSWRFWSDDGDRWVSGLPVPGSWADAKRHNLRALRVVVSCFNTCAFEHNNAFRSRHDALMPIVADAVKLADRSKDLELVILTDDQPVAGFAFAPCIHQYAMDDTAAMPDFTYGGFPEAGIESYDDTCAATRAAGRLAPEKCQVVGWIGNAGVCPVRQQVKKLVHESKQIEFIDTGDWAAKPPTTQQKRCETGTGVYLSIPELVAKYEWLIDIEGGGYSGRLKLLLHSGRCLLLVDRPWKEDFFSWLKPWTHYVPVKRDLSDLFDRVAWLSAHKKEAATIAAAAQEFALAHLTRAAAVRRWAKAILLM